MGAFLGIAGLTPVRLFLDERNVRAWPGGVGDHKMGGNYAPTILPQAAAMRDQGTPQASPQPNPAPKNPNSCNPKP